MIYQIWRNNIEILQVKPLDSSELSQKKQSEDIVRLNFVLTTFTELLVGDYIVLPKTKEYYYLNKKPRVVENPKNYQYDCIFEGTIHELRKTKVVLQTAKSGGGYYQDYKFPLTGTAQTFLDFIVSNLNRNGTGYTAGKYKTTGTATIEFNNWSAAEAIYEISNTLGFNWYLDGKQLNFDDKNLETAYVFQVGRKLGFTELTRTRVDSEFLETVVYGYGSTKNLPPRTGSGSTYDGQLLTENRLSFDGVNGESKLENNISKYGRIESIQEFEEIKPERVGTVTAVNSTDETIFFDDSVDFDVNSQLLEGINPKLNFLDGKLLGLNFSFSYDNATKQITLEPYTDEGGTYPNSIQKPDIEDSYVMFDIAMPDSYIEAAKIKLQEATQDYLDKKSEGLEVYEGQIDQEFIDANNIELFLGDLIRVISSTFAIDNLYEIKELTQNINNPNIYTVKFGDVLPKNLISQIKLYNFANNQKIYNIQKNTYTTTEVNNTVNNVVSETITWEAL